MIASEAARADLREARERAFEEFHGARIRAFLRSVHARCAAFAEQGILHIARGENFRQWQIHGALDFRERGERAGCRGKFTASVIQKPKPQRARDTDAAIRRRAPA